MRHRKIQLKVCAMSKKIHRFFVDLTKNENTITITDRTTLHHMVRVLCLNVGENIEVIDGDMVYTIAITTIDARSLVGEIVATRATEKPKRAITVVLAIIKKDTFELAVSKMSELGVSKIIPLVTSRTMKKELRLSRLRDIAREAIEQSGQTHIPTISEPQTFAETLTMTSGERWMGVPHETTKLSPVTDNVTVFIGPEGGFTDDEMEEARTAGVKFFGLTTSTLKAETAAIIATYQALV